MDGSLSYQCPFSLCSISVGSLKPYTKNVIIPQKTSVYWVILVPLSVILQHPYGLGDFARTNGIIVIKKQVT